MRSSSPTPRTDIEIVKQFINSSDEDGSLLAELASNICEKTKELKKQGYDFDGDMWKNEILDAVGEKTKYFSIDEDDFVEDASRVRYSDEQLNSINLFLDRAIQAAQQRILSEDRRALPADEQYARLFILPESERDIKTSLALLTGLIRDRSSLGKNNFDFAAWKTKVLEGLRGKYPEKQLASEGFHAFLDTAIQKVRQENLIEELNRLDSKSDFLTAMKQNNTKLLEYKKNLVHTNKRWDSFWRLENTASWQETMRVIRDNAKKQLNQALQAIDEKHDSKPENRANCIREQMELLKEVVKLEIFNKHRSNYFFTGAFGQTDIVGKINEKIKAHQRYLDNYEKNRPIVVNSR